MSELKWTDIKAIITIADEVMCDLPRHELMALGERGYYEEVLKRFKDYEIYEAQRTQL